MKPWLGHCVACLLMVFAQTPLQAADIVIDDARIIEPLSVRSWAELRDTGVTKQKFDYSCGAAALSGLLAMQFMQDTSEAEIIDRIGVKSAFSMADLAQVAAELGFKPVGLTLDFEMLIQFKRPVIVYLNYWDDGHFSVLKSIDAHGVWLADPAWGNTRWRREYFERFWLDKNGDARRGKILAVLPASYASGIAFPGLAPMPPGRLTAPALEWYNPIGQ